MSEKYEKAIKVLKENNQTKIIDLLNRLNGEEKNNLIDQVLSLDLEQISKLYKITMQTPEILEKKIENLKYIDEYKMSEEDKSEYKRLGEEVIKNNQYAVVTMAGGQGTRLGHNGPKGTFKLDVKPEGKYLFQILAEGILKANEKYGVVLPWYIMTSTENNDETISFFEEHSYFGYPKNAVTFFMQGNLPLLFTDGNLVIGKNHKIKIASDGNGCIYKSMKKDGVLEDMEKRGIKWVFVGAVDNAILNMVDPILVGLTIKEGNQIASKSIAKKDPTERVGVFCKANNVPSVIEYSELPEDMAKLRDEHGELLYGEAHIMCNLFTLEALKKVSEIDLEYHVANKKANYLNEKDEYIEVSTPNAYKFEAFIFDAFNYFDNISILRGKREMDFAPVKNKQGNDSPETAIKLYNDYFNK